MSNYTREQYMDTIVAGCYESLTRHTPVLDDYPVDYYVVVSLREMAEAITCAVDILTTRLMDAEGGDPMGAGQRVMDRLDTIQRDWGSGTTAEEQI